MDGTGGTGIGAYKYGTAGDLIRDLEVVLPTGIIIHTGDKRVPANGGGPNLNWLFVGSEGILGVVTEVTLSILPKPEEMRTVSYSFEDLSKFATCAEEARQERCDTDAHHVRRQGSTSITSGDWASTRPRWAA